VSGELLHEGCPVETIDLVKRYRNRASTRSTACPPWICLVVLLFVVSVALYVGLKGFYRRD